MAKFFRFPFANSGDRTAVPDVVDPAGAVSYPQGFGPDYELELGVDPTAKPVPRPETNQLYYDITDNLRQYQLNGVPEWFPASENGGVAISYPLNAVVRRSNVIYRSLIATNTVEPGTDPASWAVDTVAGPASTTTAGLARLATVPEALARTAEDLAVTPAGLGAVYALLLNNPIFPEVLGSGLFTLTNPAGNVRIAAGTQWVHRGAFTYTSLLTNLPTVASKTYHLRWDPVNGFALYDLASGTYNPSAVAETDVVFDTTYDSMLIARVVTNASNVASITALVNKAQLSTSGEVIIVAGTQSWQPVTTITGITSYVGIPFTWARTPRAWMSGALNLTVEVGQNSGEMNMGVRVLSRYQLGVFVQRNVSPGDNVLLWQAQA